MRKKKRENGRRYNSVFMGGWGGSAKNQKRERERIAWAIELVSNTRVRSENDPSQGTTKPSGKVDRITLF